nr:MAG TPA: hypothetical protein [Caudoviricetes sp.]
MFRVAHIKTKVNTFWTFILTSYKASEELD